MGESMKKISKTKRSLKPVTTFLTIILIFSTIGLTNGIETNNIADKFDSSRGTTYLSIVPANQTVGYGDTFHIIVHVDPGEPIIGVQIDLSFNATLVHAVSVAKADDTWEFFQSGIINNTSGEIHAAAVAVFGTTVSIPIDCFNITFTAQNTVGTSPLTLHNVIITDQNASPITPVITNGQVTVSSTVNLPPTFGTPSPVNGSTGQPLSFSWNIPINDPEGDLFSWSIQCSNGQSSSGSSASNGTKSLPLSGLAYSTTYTVWVNATDPSGSGQTTSGYYTFTTESNDPPQITNPSPVNGSTGVPISTTTLSIYISDPDGDTFSWSIQTSPNIGSNSGSSASNGTKTCTISGLQYNTTYYWFVNATDPSGSGVTTYKWYYFTTETHINDPPSFSNEIPPDESANVPLSTSILSVDISDPEGDNIDWTIQTIPNVGSSSGTGQTSGTKTCTISGLAYNTTYTWIVSAIDPSGSGEWTTETYIFTTENKPIPDLMCYGDLTWLNVKKGSTVQDSFTLENIGEPNSELDWKIESWPDWGVWTFNPSSGENLKPSDGNVTIQVTVVAPNARIRPRTIQNPDGKLSSYQGYVKVVNKESSNDYYNIPVLLTTPRTKTNPNLFLITFLQKLIDRFPMLEKYLQFFPIFNLILKLST